MKKAISTIFGGLIAAHVVALSQLPADGATGGYWIQLLPAGTFSTRDGRGPFTMAESDMAGVIEATQKYLNAVDIVVDYDHQTQFSAVPGVGGVAPAAGWIKQLEARADGLYGLVDWTANAAAAIRADEYRYISPVFQFDKKTGKVWRLTSAGLTNTPALDLAAIAASTQLQQDETMEQIAKALGLAPAADENSILTAINSLLTGTAAIAVAAGLNDKASSPEIVTAINSARAAANPAKFVPIEQVEALQQEIATLKNTVTGGQAETAINKAIADGKLTPALRDWGMDLFKKDAGAFNAFIDKSPVLTASQAAGKSGPTGDAELDAVDLAVMSQMGISREDFLKTKKAGDA